MSNVSSRIRKMRNAGKHEIRRLQISESWGRHANKCREDSTEGCIGEELKSITLVLKFKKNRGLRIRCYKHKRSRSLNNVLFTEHSTIIPIGEWSFMSVLKCNDLLGTLTLILQIKIHSYCSQHCFHSILSYNKVGTSFLVAREMNLKNFSLFLLLS